MNIYQVQRLVRRSGRRIVKGIGLGSAIGLAFGLLSCIGGDEETDDCVITDVTGEAVDEMEEEVKEDLNKLTPTDN